MKRVYIIIAILFLIVCTIIGYVLHSSRNKTLNTPLQSPTALPTGSLSNTKNDTITPGSTSVPILQNPTIQKELNLLENRQPLTNTDSDVKSRLINSLQNGDETINSTADYNLDYIAPLDEFQVEILTTNTQQAKEEATNWLITQGMTHDGICKLPLIFYTNSFVYRQLKNQGIRDVTPLAEGC